eukprot:TRINITY_DN4552_c0_g1_i1.p1 TRINITY_DN4552_c0_g1~~TRINITY_DN4552_c0_g1_i1.p1  ORF type:complete len:194 (-),score=21.04 TRINITY_DN4552_c0_g1_i1:176-757(-)
MDFSSPPPQTVSPPANEGLIPTYQVKRHPIALFFHLFFKTSALLVYLLLGIFYDQFIVQFVTVMLLIGCDFWTVKNVTGRLLVGLRWWNIIKEDGSSEWKFESVQNRDALSDFEVFVFWLALAVNIILWVLLAIVALIKLNPHWLIICIIATVLTFTNIVGYIKCIRDAKSRIKTMAAQYIANQVVEDVQNKL